MNEIDTIPGSGCYFQMSDTCARKSQHKHEAWETEDKSAGPEPTASVLYAMGRGDRGPGVKTGTSGDQQDWGRRDLDVGEGVPEDRRDQSMYAKPTWPGRGAPQHLTAIASTNGFE